MRPPRNLLALSILLFSHATAAAQEAGAPAAQPAAETQLPEIEVTAPSPVAKPSKSKSAAKKKQQSASAGPDDGGADTAAGETPPAIPLAPGTLLVVEDSFAPVTVATDAEITAKQGATITDTLAGKPGIAGSTFAPGANRPIIRGLDNYRVRVQENGIGTHDVSALSEDHAVPIDPSAADRVEVVRGPATLRYGSQAIGGVVAVENQRVPAFIPNGGFTGQIKGGHSSVDDGNDGSFEAQAGAAGVAVHADGFKRNAGDYDTPEGKQANSFVESEGGSAGISRVWENGFVGVAFVRNESLYGVPGEEALEERPRIDLEQDKMLARGEWRPNAMGIEAMRFWFGASEYAHNEVVGDGEVGSRFTNDEQEVRAELQHVPFATPLGEMSGAVGVQWGYRNMRGQSFEGESLLEPARTQVIAGFWFEELELSQKLRFQAAARIEHNEVDGFGIEDPLGAATGGRFNKTYVPVSGSVGFLYELPMDVVARLTGQYVERAPDAAELFSKGVHEATGTFEIGNPDLEKEKAATAELGFKKATGALRFDASVYYTRFDGFIFKEQTGEGCGDFLNTCGLDDELDQLVFGQRDAAFYGAEIAVQYDVASLWRGVWGIDGQYDVVQAEFDNGENIQRIPPQRLGGGLFYSDPAWFARVGLLHAFEQTDVGLEETPTDEYTLVSAEAAYSAKSGSYGTPGAEWTLGIKGENLLDDEVRNHASFKKDEVLLPGASVRVFGSIKLN